LGEEIQRTESTKVSLLIRGSPGMRRDEFPEVTQRKDMGVSVSVCAQSFRCSKSVLKISKGVPGLVALFYLIPDQQRHTTSSRTR
jgi:hypothetical protein